MLKIHTLASRERVEARLRIFCAELENKIFSPKSQKQQETCFGLQCMPCCPKPLHSFLFFISMLFGFLVFDLGVATAGKFEFSQSSFCSFFFFFSNFSVLGNLPALSVVIEVNLSP